MRIISCACAAAHISIRCFFDGSTTTVHKHVLEKYVGILGRGTRRRDLVGCSVPLQQKHAVSYRGRRCNRFRHMFVEAMPIFYTTYFLVRVVLQRDTSHGGNGTPMVHGSTVNSVISGGQWRQNATVKDHRGHGTYCTLSAQVR